MSRSRGIRRSSSIGSSRGRSWSPIAHGTGEVRVPSETRGKPVRQADAEQGPRDALSQERKEINAPERKASDLGRRTGSCVLRGVFANEPDGGRAK
jgi:hypothetical protein